MKKGVGRRGSMIVSVCGGISGWFGAWIVHGRHIYGKGTMVGMVVGTGRHGRMGIGVRRLQLLAMTVPLSSLSLLYVRM
jgi:hypothetical protein